MQRLSWIPRLALVIAGGALLIVAIVVGVAPRIWQMANAHSEDPVALDEFAPLAQRTYVYDAFGNEIAYYELENSQPVKYEDIPLPVIQAFLLVEDKEFFTHDGVNVRSLFRATLSNFASDAPQQGASTIDMQVVKNDFLAGLERDGRYKLLQIQYAKRLDKEMPKERILERYLNTVFFGNNAYGIQAAAETYYGTTVDKLTFLQAAFLAGLVRSPSGFDPINQPERSRARWKQVLERLVTEEILTEPEAERVFESEPIPERVKRIESRTNTRTYFTEALRDYLLNQTNILGETYEERYNQLFRGGLRIHTTLDPNMQVAGERAQELLPQSSQGFEAALASLDSTNGAVRAMVGGRGFSSDDQVNMALAPRQTGSSIKIFILAAAIQAGAQGGDQIDGKRGCSFANPGDVDEPVYTIDDGVAGFIGTLRDITAKSVNCGFARLSQIVGLNRVVDTTYRMAESPYLNRGIPETERRPIEPFISFATGANEMSPLDMASGVQTLANEGVHKQPYFVEYIDNADGERLHTHTDPGTPVFDRDAALETVDILKGTLDYGTARFKDLEGGREAFGKTGTQEKNTNAWFVGGTRQLSTAVWVGDPDEYTPMVNIPEFNVSKVQGGTYPADIWKNFMDTASYGMPLADWDDPPPPARPNARLVLPGNECGRVVVGTRGGEVIPNRSSNNSRNGSGPQGIVLRQTDGEEPDDTTGSAGATTPSSSEPSSTESPSSEPSSSAPSSTPSTTRSTSPPVRTTPIVQITENVDLGSTVPPEDLDPNATLPSVPLSTNIYKC